ncbi:unnamed protein product [Neospora caninum Liverpool]|uniref:AP2 domain transcription factor AP2XII-2 n=1 Tax=Neospora caninum (strain Liverpool) TaxID=572307 RepID=F0VQ26_NEOCL|nr:uncharacterized protein NCLIV_062490 [Neospora caninum Liverpool]CBZ55823.1 unnamed protein product [Neospora caninum Liverpool]CEL70565.1 TPA: AP2 domain transcription factor AP2XII-2 [Neospora caninum Liverpool]|eukprot:XP_003885849.1 uncharacterized protein NCLIV_062490 [Neospora caninum Liverpool]
MGPQSDASFDIVGTEDSATADNELPGPRVSSPSRCTTTASVALLPAFPVSADSAAPGTATGETGKLQALVQAKTEDGTIPAHASARNVHLPSRAEKMNVPDEACGEAETCQPESFFPETRDPLSFPETSRALLHETPGIASFARPRIEPTVPSSAALSAMSLPANPSLLNSTQSQESPASSCLSQCFPGAAGVPCPTGTGNRGGVSAEALQRLIGKSPLHVQALLATMRQQCDGQLGATARALSRQLWAAAARASPAVLQQQLRLRSQLLARLALERSTRGQACARSTPATAQAKKERMLEPTSAGSGHDSSRPGATQPRVQDLNHQQAQRLRQAEVQLERPEVFTVLHNRSAAILHFVLRALGLLANCCPRWSGVSPLDSVAASSHGQKGGSKHVDLKAVNSAFTDPTMCLRAGSLDSKMRDEFGLDVRGPVLGGAGCAGQAGIHISGTGGGEAERPLPSSYRWHWLHVVSFADKPELLTIYYSTLAPLLSLVSPSVSPSGQQVSDAAVSSSHVPKGSAPSFASQGYAAASPTPSGANPTALSEQAGAGRSNLCGLNSALVLLQVLRDLDDLRSLHDPVFLPSGLYPLQLLGKQQAGLSAQLSGTGDANQDGACGEGCRCTVYSDSVCGLAVLRRSPFFPCFVEAATALLAWPAAGAAVAAASLPPGMLDATGNRGALESCRAGKDFSREPQPSSNTDDWRRPVVPSQSSAVGSTTNRDAANHDSLVATARGLAECVLKHVDLNSLDGSDLLALLRLSEHLKPSLEEAPSAPACSSGQLPSSADTAGVAHAAPGNVPGAVEAIEDRYVKEALAAISGNSFGINFEETETGQGTVNSVDTDGRAKLNSFGDSNPLGESGKGKSQRCDSTEGLPTHTDTTAREIPGAGSQGSGTVSGEAQIFQVSTDLSRHSESSTGSGQTAGANSSKETSPLRVAPTLDSLVLLPEMRGSESPSSLGPVNCQSQEHLPPHTLLRFSPLFSRGAGIGSSADRENPSSCSSLSTGNVGVHGVPAPVSPVETLLPGSGRMFGLQEPLPEGHAACSLGDLLCPAGVDEASGNLLSTENGTGGCATDRSGREGMAFESLFPSAACGYSFSRLPSQDAECLPSEVLAAAGFPATPLEGSPLTTGLSVHDGLGHECDLSALGGRPDGTLRQPNAGFRTVGEAGPGRRGVRQHAAGSRLLEKRAGKHTSRTPGAHPARLHEVLPKKKDYGLPASACCDEASVGSSLAGLQGGIAAAACGIGVRNKRARTQEPVTEGELSGNRDGAWSDAPEGAESLPDLLSRGGGSLAAAAAGPTHSPCKVKPSARTAGGTGARRAVAVATSRGLAASTSSSVRSAVKGIYFDSYKKLWRVQWNRSGSSGSGGSGGAGRRVSRSFSCARLGFEAAKARAVAWMLSGGLVGDGGLPSGDSRLGSAAGNGTAANAEGLSDRNDGSLTGSAMTPELLLKEEKERLLFADPRLFLERIEAFYIRHRLYGLQCNGSGAGGSQNGSEDSANSQGEAGSNGNRRGNGGSGGLRIVSVLSLDDMLAVLNGTKHGMGEQDTSEPLVEREEEVNEDRSRTGDEDGALCGSGACDMSPLNPTALVPQPQTESLTSRKKLKREKGAPVTGAADRPSAPAPLPGPFVGALSEEMEKHLLRLLPSLAPVTAQLKLDLQACHAGNGGTESFVDALAAELDAAAAAGSSGIAPEEHGALASGVPPLSG